MVIEVITDTCDVGLTRFSSITAANTCQHFPLPNYPSQQTPDNAFSSLEGAGLPCLERVFRCIDFDVDVDFRVSWDSGDM